MANQKINGFMIGMGVAGLAAVGVFAGLVVPAWSQAAQQKKTIQTNVNRINTRIKDMPGEKNLKAWEDYADQMKNGYAAYVQNLGKRDEHLDKWFDGMGPTTTFQEFLIRYGDQAKLLDKRLRDAQIKVGVPRVLKDETGEDQVQDDGELGFNWASSASFKDTLSGDEQSEAKVQLQKRYWIAEYVANALLADADAKPARLIDLHFLHPSPVKGLGKQKFVDFHAAGGSSGATGAELYKEISKDQAIADRVRMYQVEAPGSLMTAATFNEYQLPLNGEPDEAGREKPLGWTITFGVSVEMDYAGVSKLVRNFCEPRQGFPLPIQVVGLDVFVPKQNPLAMTPEEMEKIDPTFKIPKFTKDQTQEIAEWKAAFEKRRESIKPAKARAIIVCQVLDLDPANLPSFAKKAQ